jgi:hypothetical protein
MTVSEPPASQASQDHFRAFVDRAVIVPPTPDPNDYPVGCGPFPYQGDIYHSDNRRISSSVVKAIQNDPDKVRRKLAGEIAPSNDSMDFGSVVGELLAIATPWDADKPASESQKFFFADVERPDRRTKAGQAVWAFAESNACGRGVVWLDQFAKARRCADRLMQHPEIAAFNRDAHVLKEFALQAKLPEFSGVFGKCMFDWVKFVGPDQIEVMDVKTSQSPDPWGFRRQVFDFGYHIQERFYRAVASNCGLRVVRFRFAVVGNDEAAYPAVYELQKEFWLDMATRPIAEAAYKFQEIQKGQFDWLPNWSHGNQRIEVDAKKSF